MADSDLNRIKPDIIYQAAIKSDEITREIHNQAGLYVLKVHERVSMAPKNKIRIVPAELDVYPG